MNFSDVITAAILSEKLDVSPATAGKLLKEIGGGQKHSGVTFYSREAVQSALVERNHALLTFLQYQPLTVTPMASEENADV